MKLFGLFERKQSVFGAMLARFSVGRAAWPDRSAALQASEGYRKNVVAYRCVRLIAESAASIPLCLYDGDKEIDRHPLLDLIAHPNPVQDGTALLEAWYSFLQIAGNSYLERVDGLGGRPAEVYVLRPDRVKVVPGTDGFPAAWEFTANGVSRRVAADFGTGKIPILHLRMFHPLDDWYGLSPLDPAAWSVDAFSAAANYNKSLLDNAAVPSGAIKVSLGADGIPRSLDDAQRERLRAELESRYTGAANAGRPMVLEGGLDWQTFSQSMADMQFVDSKRDSARDIALAFGVPPMMLGIPGDNTYANYQEANRSFWRATVIPLALRAAKALTQWLAPAFGPSLKLVPNTDDIDALAADRQAQWDRINATTHLTLNEKRAAVGYEPVKGGDVFVLPKGATLSDLTTPEKDKSNGD